MTEDKQESNHNKVVITQQQYDELSNLLSIMADDTRSMGERRIAMAEFDYIFKNLPKEVQQ